MQDVENEQDNDNIHCQFLKVNIFFYNDEHLDV